MTDNLEPGADPLILELDQSPGDARAPAIEPRPEVPHPTRIYAPAHEQAASATVEASGPPAQPASAPVVTGSVTRPPMTQAPIEQTEHAIDPVLAGFDHLVALASYGLLFVSVFMAGVPALATLVLAYAHKQDSHPVARSHFRFQLRIFWTAILFLALCLGSAVAAGGLAIAKLADFARDNLPGLSGVMTQAGSGAWSAQIAGLMVVAAVMFFVLAVVWTLGASVFGFLRLLANKPIGHSKPGL